MKMKNLILCAALALLAVACNKQPENTDTGTAANTNSAPGMTNSAPMTNK